MPGLHPYSRRNKLIQISSFNRGLHSNPRLNNEFNTLENLYVRDDGWLVHRGRLVSTGQNFTTEVPKGLWWVDPSIGFNYVVATSSNWYGIKITNQTPPIQYTSTTLKAFTEGTRPSLTAGMNKSGTPAIFFTGYDGTGVNVYQYDTALTTLTAWTNQVFVGFWNNTLFGGGGTSTALSNKVLYSTQGDPTTVPAADLTDIQGTFGGIPMDMVVVEDSPMIVTTTGIATLAGAGATGYPYVTRSGFRDQLLGRTVSTSGSTVLACGVHGLYDLGDNLKELSPIVKSWWYPPPSDINTLSLSFGRAAFSTNGFFYAMVLNNSTIGGTVNTSDNALLVYDLRMQYFFLVSFPNFAPLFIAPGGADMGTGGFNFTSFALLGKDITNARYTLAFWQLTNGDLTTYQDLPVTSTGAAAAATDYTTHLTTANLYDGDPYSEKMVRDLLLSGQSVRANVQITLKGLPQGSTTLTQVQQWTSQQLPAVKEFT